jgi:hypothetical protein
VIDRLLLTCSLAFGVVVVVAGLLIDSLTITPLGAAVALLSGVGLCFGTDRRTRAISRGPAYLPNNVALPDRAVPMSLYELDVSWAITANEQRHLLLKLLACERVRAVFPTPRQNVVAVLFSDDRGGFSEWEQSLEPEAAGNDIDFPNPTTLRGPDGSRLPEGGSR